MRSIPFPTQRRIEADTSGNLPGTIELLRSGSWRTPYHGDFDLLPADLDQAVANFEAGIYRVNGTEPLAGTLDHDHRAAAFRIESVYMELDASSGEAVLVGRVTWTELGKEKLARDEYRYISSEYNPRTMPLENPEKEGEFWVNVLTGATLTNDPLFKKLKKVMASVNTSSDNNKGASMNLKDILAKAIADVTDEEKAFVAEHKAELTDEQRAAFGLEAEETAEQKAEREAAEAKAKEEADAKAKAEAEAAEAARVEASAGIAQISKEKLAKLEADAKAGREAQQKLERAELRSGVEAHARVGRIKAAMVDEVTDILMASTPAIREKLGKVFAALPENPLLQKEAGESARVEASATITDVERQFAADFNLSEEDLAEYKRTKESK